jgi:hypothetical protein
MLKAVLGSGKFGLKIAFAQYLKGVLKLAPNIVPAITPITRFGDNNLSKNLASGVISNHFP